MVLRSTRDPLLRVSLEQAVFSGLAPDGGLYVPVSHLDLRRAMSVWGPATTFAEVAQAASADIFEGDLGAGGGEAVARRAFPFAPALRRLDEEVWVLELFHGPSCAFKDFGASFLAAAMDAYCERTARTATVLVATSGDTGSAVAQAFRDRANVRVVILYPSGRVSPLQERQLTTVGGNVCALEVTGSFDDCQRMAKEAFLDPGLVEALRLTSANSINVGRFLPQAFYFLWAWAAAGGGVDAGKTESVRFVVPSGNLGNLASGLYAWRWGMEAAGFLAATNANDVLPEYLSSGLFRPRASVQTISNAMDVGNPSNMERILDLLGGRRLETPLALVGEAVSDVETVDGMREAHRRYGYVMDPHTAVGFVAEGRHRARAGRRQTGRVVLLATAHPAKFVDTVREALGIEPEIPAQLEAAARGTKVSVVVGPSSAALRTFLLEELDRRCPFRPLR